MGLLKVVQKAIKDIDPETLKATKEKIVQAFEDAGIPVPQEMQSPVELSKKDQKIIHVGAQHLYGGVLDNLRASKKHLEKIYAKDPSALTKAWVDSIDGMITSSTTIINSMSKQVDKLPNVDQMDELQAKLQAEYEKAALLQLMDTDIPKEKMH